MSPLREHLGRAGGLRDPQERDDGVFVASIRGSSYCLLRGGTISGNKHYGERAITRGKVAVAEADEDGLPHTVCKDNEEGDWATMDSVGIPQEKINVSGLT